MRTLPDLRATCLAALALVTGCAPTYTTRPYAYGQGNSSYQTQQPAYEAPADAGSIVAGNTVTIEAPVFDRRGRVARFSHSSIYFAPDGRAYSPAFAGQRWSARGNQVCMAGGSNDCTTFYGDGTGQMFAASNGKRFRVASIVPGDGSNLRTAYQRNRNNEAAAGLLALGVLGMMMSGGSGGSSDSSRQDTYYYRQSGQSGSSGGGSSYTAPIGGERGLYGSSHGVGD